MPRNRNLANLALSLLIPALAACGACKPAAEAARDSALQRPAASRPAAPPAPAFPAAPRSAPLAGSTSTPRAGGAPGIAAPGAAASMAAPLVAFLGDSLTAGLGLPLDQAYPALVGEKMKRLGAPIRVLNAGVSGDTSAGGLRRLSWILAQRPAVVVVELGANDALRAQPPEEIERNLREIVSRARAAGARVLLVGMQIPPNYGPDYAGRFAAIYPRLARELHVALVPFLLSGVGGISELNQADGIHPTAEGHERVAATVAPYLLQVLTGNDHAEPRAAQAPGEKRRAG
jgi:acyl-CoA thioesterase-1